MAEKKTHEVDKMSRFVSQLVRNHKVQSLVDLGSGKAYLSQVLNSLYNIPVLAIDSKETNTTGGQVREQKLKSKWGGLSSRAAERAAGEAPSNRKTRQKTSKIVDKPAETDFVSITKYVQNGSDINSLVEEHLPDVCDRVGVIGLHTCGDLAPNSIKIFLQSSKSVILCNVGCCYNHLSDTGFPMYGFLRNKNYQVSGQTLDILFWTRTTCACS